MLVVPPADRGYCESMRSRAGLLCLSAAAILKCRIITPVADFFVMIHQVRKLFRCKQLKVADCCGVLI